MASPALHRVQQVAVDDPGAENLANVLDEEPGVAVAETERVAQLLAGGDVVDVLVGQAIQESPAGARGERAEPAARLPQGVEQVIERAMTPGVR